MSLGRQTPETITISGTTTTGNSTQEGQYGIGMQSLSVAHKITGTTGGYTFTVQGSIGRSDVWQALMAATTGSTAGKVANSTVAMTFDKVRINLSANPITSTGGEQIDFHILAR